MRSAEKRPRGRIPARQAPQTASPAPGSPSEGQGLRTDLKALWQSILDCDCNTRGMWCSDCCEAFGEIGNFLDTLDRKCPVCGGPCKVVIACPEHE